MDILYAISDEFVPFSIEECQSQHNILVCLCSTCGRGYEICLSIVPNEILLRNFINFSIRHIVFRNRHQNLGNCKAVIVRNMIRKIAFFLKSELKTKFSLALVNRKIDSFINTFLIDGILGSIDENILTLKDLY